jgi:hypothetical protein
MHSGIVEDYWRIVKEVEALAYKIFAQLPEEEKRLPTQAFLNSLSPQQASPVKEESNPALLGSSPRLHVSGGLSSRSTVTPLRLTARGSTGGSPIPLAPSSPGSRRGSTVVAPRSAPFSTEEWGKFVQPALGGEALSDQTQAALKHLFDKGVISALPPTPPTTQSPRSSLSSARGAQLAPSWQQKWIDAYLSEPFGAQALSIEQKGMYGRIFLVLFKRDSMVQLNEKESAILKSLSDYLGIFLNVYDVSKKECSARSPEGDFSQKVEALFRKKVSDLEQKNFLGPSRENDEGFEYLISDEALYLILSCLGELLAQANRVKKYAPATATSSALPFDLPSTIQKMEALRLVDAVKDSSGQNIEQYRLIDLHVSAKTFQDQLKILSFLLRQYKALLIPEARDPKREDLKQRVVDLGKQLKEVDAFVSLFLQIMNKSVTVED